MNWKFPLLTTLLVTLPMATSATSSQGFLANRHIARGMNCVSCHITQGNPKLKMVDNASHEVCVQCHGFYDKVVKLTEKKDEQNPHAQHDGNLPCSECHKGHKPSVNYCAQCHNFEFKVP